jgi:hypothetical protein
MRLLAACATVTVTGCETVPYAAATLVEPFFFAVTRPVVSTVATRLLPDVHVTLRPGIVAPCWSSTVAVSVRVWLIAVKDTAPEGETLIVVGVGGSVPLLHATSAQATPKVAIRPDNMFLMHAPLKWRESNHGPAARGGQAKLCAPDPRRL